MKIQKKIGGYNCEIQINDERVYCYVSKGKGTASLDYLSDMGSLYDINGNNIIQVPESTIDQITKWALDYGY